ncbi:hypothetical protein [Bradyrhizobium sp.]|uniref:hypothetical protein n=1 Tax=Bradyrhizobium sp. TaxID=376 RepID=UPI002BDA2658|nr:hypothetical protein [Bradyrhizobium sp.]HMM92632.1 hypothetical protein [Bradyrhizobium sp.]
MRIQSTEGQVWWIALPDEIRPVRGIDGSQISSGLQSIFNFSSPPNEIKGGVEFYNGRLANGDHDILITKLAIFNDGINIQVPTDTEDAEKILQRTLIFAFEMGVRRPISEVLHFYQSVIVADFETSLESILPSALLKKISKALPIDGESHFLNIGTNFDTTAIHDARWRGVNPTLFRIDRRASMPLPYDLNRYFCLANMKTPDHIEVLSDFEKFASTVRR